MPFVTEFPECDGDLFPHNAVGFSNQVAAFLDWAFCMHANFLLLCSYDEKIRSQYVKLFLQTVLSLGYRFYIFVCGIFTSSTMPCRSAQGRNVQRISCAT